MATAGSPVELVVWPVPCLPPPSSTTCTSASSDHLVSSLERRRIGLLIGWKCGGHPIAPDDRPEGDQGVVNDDATTSPAPPLSGGNQPPSLAPPLSTTVSDWPVSTIMVAGFVPCSYLAMSSKETSSTKTLDGSSEETTSPFLPSTSPTSADITGHHPLTYTTVDSAPRPDDHRHHVHALTQLYHRIEEILALWRQGRGIGWAGCTDGRRTGQDDPTPELAPTHPTTSRRYAHFRHRNAPYPCCCSGCIRRICFEPLQVLAVAICTDQPSSSVSSTAPAPPNLEIYQSLCAKWDLPVIFLSSDQTFPTTWPPKPEQGLKNSPPSFPAPQIVLYDSPEEPCLYHHHQSAASSTFFATTLLPRCTHARLVVSTLQRHLRPGRPTAERAGPATESLERPGVPARKRWRPEEQLKKILDRADPLPAMLVRAAWKYSLLIRHVSYQGGLYGPLQAWPIVAAFQTWKDGTWSLRPTQVAVGPDPDHAGEDEICPHCQSRGKLLGSTLTVPEMIQQSVQDTQEQLLGLMDLLLGGILGLGMAFALWNGRLGALCLAAIQYQHAKFSEGTEWLETYPIGFKLNEQLTHHLGQSVRWFIQLHSTVLEAVIDRLRHPPLSKMLAVFVLVLSVSGGASGLLALLFDTWRLGCWPYHFLAWGFRWLYRSELYLLAALWRLFQGKKRNVLRQRTDTMQYDSMQLLLGTILFAVALFLFTTFLVYQVFFGILELFLCTLLAALAGLYLSLHIFPWGRLYWRWRRPLWFTEQVYLDDLLSTHVLLDEPSLTTKLVPQPISLTRIISEDMKPGILALIKWLLCVLSSVVVGVGSRRSVTELACPGDEM